MSDWVVPEGKCNADLKVPLSDSSDDENTDEEGIKTNMTCDGLKSKQAVGINRPPRFFMRVPAVTAQEKKVAHQKTTFQRRFNRPFQFKDTIKPKLRSVLSFKHNKKKNSVFVLNEEKKSVL